MQKIIIIISSYMICYLLTAVYNVFYMDKNIN